MAGLWGCVSKSADFERVHRLVAHPSSVGAARRIVRELLSTADREDLVDAAQVVVSELVTNAVIHAGTHIDLRARFADTGLRVEIWDGNPQAPADRHYGALAGTGRGLHLVDELVDRWGTLAHPDGKTVWFEIASADEEDAPLGIADTARPTPDAREEMLDVVLLDMPLLLHAAWHEHAESLLREQLLIGLEDDDPVRAVELHAMASDALSRLHSEIPAPAMEGDPQQLLARAVEPHVTSEREVLAIPRHAVANFDVLDGLLDSALALADTGALLTPPIQPELRDLRRWLCAEVSRQHEGEPPTAWTNDPDSASPPTRPPLSWDPTTVNTSSSALVAADDTDQIVALSRPASRLLGYDNPDELLHKRLVAIIPPRYHQAHLAGFSLHLSNGRAPLLGRAVIVPVLRRDGTETRVELSIERHRLPGGRQLYVADMRPLGD